MYYYYLYLFIVILSSSSAQPKNSILMQPDVFSYIINKWIHAIRRNTLSSSHSATCFSLHDPSLGTSF